jgi:hypothetical protein
MTIPEHMRLHDRLLRHKQQCLSNDYEDNLPQGTDFLLKLGN